MKQSMKIKYILLGFSLFIITSCSDFLDPEDSKYATTEQVPDILERNPDAAVRGIYSRMIQYAFYASRHDDFGQKSLDISVDVGGEDIVHYANKQWFVDCYHLEDRVATARRPARQWQYCYANIRDLNTILELYPLEEVPNLDDQQKQMRGEALALRAYHYFLLINLFQTAGTWEHIKDLPGVPVYETASLEGKARGTVTDVYERIKADFEEAIPLLEGFTQNTVTRVDQTAAKALAARVYLYAGEYENALKWASEVVSSSKLMTIEDYTSGFDDISNVEWLWGVDVNAENSTTYPSFFSMMDPVLQGYAGMLGQYKCIDRRLYDHINDDDIRKQCFKNSEYEIPYVQYKFIDKSDKFLADLVFLRVADAYYIKAEAEVRTGNAEAAKTTLDAITNARAVNGTHTYTWSSIASELLNQIFIQKRIELWGEGQSLFEFNRLEKEIDRTYEGTNHPVGNIISGGDHIVSWHDPIRTLQIPIKEFEGNKNINTSDQNP